MFGVCAYNRLGTFLSTKCYKTTTKRDLMQSPMLTGWVLVPRLGFSISLTNHMPVASTQVSTPSWSALKAGRRQLTGQYAYT